MKSHKTTINKQSQKQMMSADQVTNLEYLNLYQALVRLPAAELYKVIPGAIPGKETSLQRGWTGHQLAIMHRNKITLTPHAQELILQIQHVEKLQKRSSAAVIKASAENSIEGLKTEMENIAQIIEEHNTMMLGKIALPVLEKIPFSVIADTQIMGNQFMDLLMTHIFDFEK